MSSPALAPRPDLNTRSAWTARHHMVTSDPTEEAHLRGAYADWLHVEGLDLGSIHPGRTLVTREDAMGLSVYHRKSTCPEIDRGNESVAEVGGAALPFPHPDISWTLCRHCHEVPDLVNVPFLANVATSRFLESYALTVLQNVETPGDASRALRELSCHAVFTREHKGFRSDPYSERLPAAESFSRPEQAALVRQLRDSEAAADRIYAQLLSDGTLVRVVEMHTGTPAGETVWFVLPDALRTYALEDAGPWAFTWRTRAEMENLTLIEAPRAAYGAVQDHVSRAEPALRGVAEPVLIGALTLLKSTGFTTGPSLHASIAALT